MNKHYTLSAIVLFVAATLAFNNCQAQQVEDFYNNYIANCAYQPALGMPTLHNNAAVALVPNPATDEVLITSDVEISNVAVYDLQGRLMFANTYSTNHIKLNTKTLQRGLYLVKVNAGKNTVTKKLTLK